jgi:DNA (cytosine-5)-methyltransferase 1
VSGRCIVSIFPGIDLLGRAFEAEFPEASLLRGPDVLWGGDIRSWHLPPGIAWGVIGGPPCQAFSRLVHIVKAKGQTPRPNLIPEFERVVGEGQPDWFLMENVPAAPEPIVSGSGVTSLIFNNRWAPEAPEQNRERRFSFGLRDGQAVLAPETCAIGNPSWERTVVATSSKEGALAKSRAELRDAAHVRAGRGRGILPGQEPRRSIERCAVLQGLPPDFLADAPFTAAGKYAAIGNGVPIPMGRAIARAVRRALGLPLITEAAS